MKRLKSKNAALSIILLIWIQSASNAQDLKPVNNQRRPNTQPDSTYSASFIISRYRLDEAQQKNLRELAVTLMRIAPLSPVDEERIANVRDHLLAVADEAAKQHAPLVNDLAKRLLIGLRHRGVSEGVKSQIAADLWFVLNMSLVNSASLSATARICNTLESEGVSKSDLLKLRDAINAIVKQYYNK